MRYSLISLLAILSITVLADDDNRLNTPVSFVFDARPIAILIAPNSNDLDLARGSQTDHTEGNIAEAPNFKIGPRFHTPWMDLELTAGIGGLWHPDFYGGFYQFDIAPRFEIDKGVTFGPHIGIITFDSVFWRHSSKMTINNNSGWLGGIAIDFRRKTFGLLIAIDYLDCELDLYPQDGWTTNHSELDISGIVLQIGLVWRF